MTLCAARVGDATAHGGPIKTGSPSVFINELPAAAASASVAPYSLGHGDAAVVTGSGSLAGLLIAMGVSGLFANLFVQAAIAGYLLATSRRWKYQNLKIFLTSFGRLQPYTRAMRLGMATCQHATLLTSKMSRL